MKEIKKIQHEERLIENISLELASFLNNLEKKYNIPSKSTLQILKNTEKKILSKRIIISPDKIPSCILKNRKLSSLEAITKYLKENCGLKYPEIALKLNRNPGTIGVTYRKAKKKFSSNLNITVGPEIPVSIFKNRDISVLENIVHYLKNLDMTLHEIAVLMNRDDRTIWTVNHRAEMKLKKKNIR